MKLISKNGATISVELTRVELILLNNSLNEILNGINAIEENQFHTMTGTKHIDAEKLLAQIQAILN